eukprot:365326-Chlamydomonas_euryale.AAC.4
MQIHTHSQYVFTKLESAMPNKKPLPDVKWNLPKDRSPKHPRAKTAPCWRPPAPSQRPSAPSQRLPAPSQRPPALPTRRMWMDSDAHA